jgi:hypothetical protein
MFADLIELWPSIGAFAADVGVPYETANSWKKRNSIPAKNWPGVIAAAQKRGFEEITAERLIELARARANNGTTKQAAE